MPSESGLDTASAPGPGPSLEEMCGGTAIRFVKLSCSGGAVSLLVICVSSCRSSGSGQVEVKVYWGCGSGAEGVGMMRDLLLVAGRLSEGELGEAGECCVYSEQRADSLLPDAEEGRQCRWVVTMGLPGDSIAFRG